MLGGGGETDAEMLNVPAWQKLQNRKNCIEIHPE
jgi:hypothetical protein